MIGRRFKKAFCYVYTDVIRLCWPVGYYIIDCITLMFSGAGKNF